MSAFEAIDLITKKAAREELDNEKSQLRFLTYWWSNKYNKPFKDPLLKEYSIEDLYYEYRMHIEFEEARKEIDTEENDKIEEQKQDEALAWAEAEEAKELEELGNEDGDGTAITNEDQEWMDRQIEMAKEVYGDSFGENITEEFNDEW